MNGSDARVRHDEMRQRRARVLDCVGDGSIGQLAAVRDVEPLDSAARAPEESLEALIRELVSDSARHHQPAPHVLVLRRTIPCLGHTSRGAQGRDVTLQHRQAAAQQRSVQRRQLSVRRRHRSCKGSQRRAQRSAAREGASRAAREARAQRAHASQPSATVDIGALRSANATSARWCACPLSSRSLRRLRPLRRPAAPRPPPPRPWYRAQILIGRAARCR